MVHSEREKNYRKYRLQIDTGAAVAGGVDTVVEAPVKAGHKLLLILEQRLRLTEEK